MARKILVDGVPRRVVENLHYNHSIGKYGKLVRIDGKDVIVTSRSPGGPWQRHVPVILPRGKVEGQ